MVSLYTLEKVIEGGNYVPPLALGMSEDYRLVLERLGEELTTNLRLYSAWHPDIRTEKQSKHIAILWAEYTYLVTAHITMPNGWKQPREITVKEYGLVQDLVAKVLKEEG